MAKELKGLLESRDAKTAENDVVFSALDARVVEWEGLPEESRGDKPDLTDDEVEVVEARTAEIDALDKRIKEETRAAKKAAAIREARALITDVVSDEQVEVVKEPLQYGPDNPEFSYYADLARSCHVQLNGHHAAVQRLASWAHQLEREIGNDTTVGRKVMVNIRGQQRDPDSLAAHNRAEEIRQRGKMSLEQKVEDRSAVPAPQQAVEVRSIATGGGATATAASGGAAFVSPAIFLDPYAPFREYGRAFADACNKQELPSYGMQIYIPAVQSPAGISQQTEGQPINETDPAFGYLNAPVITLAGEVTVSQQLLDRAGPGFAFDRLIFDQLNRDYAPKWDQYVLNQVLAKATLQQWNNASFDLIAQNGTGGFYGQISKAKAAIRTTAGTVLAPSHLFTTPQRQEYITGWGDNAYRPVFVDNHHGPFNAIGAGSTDGDAGIEGDSGWRINGLPLCTDANIPLLGTTPEDQAIVGDLQEVLVYEGAPVQRVVPQTLAGSLLVLLQMYSYCATLVRYPAAIVSISGTAMQTPVYAA